MNSSEPSVRSWIVPLLLTLGTLTAYAAIFRCEFLQYDDPDYVTENPVVRQGLTWAGVKWAFTTGHASNWHPVTWLSHQLDCQLFGVNSGWHHLMNLALHVLNVVLLFRWLARWTGALWRSALVAALFAWHPLRVESVAWVAERKDVLSGFFFLLTLHSWARYAERPGALRYLVVVVWLSLGLMAKPMLVTTPFVLLLLDWWPLQRRPGGAPAAGLQSRPWRTLMLEKAPLLALAVVFSFVTVLVQSSARSVVSVDQLSFTARCGNAFVAWWLYVFKTIWPANLAVFYPHPGYIPWWEVLLAAAFLGGATAGAVKLRIAMPWLGVGWCWFVGMMVPVIGLVQVGMQRMADRYTYLPHIGLFVALVWLGAWCAERLRVPKAARWASAIAIVLACGVLTFVQVRLWRDTRTLFEHARAVTARNHVACAVLGDLYWNSGDIANGRAYFQRALEFRPGYAEGHVAFGNGLLASGQLDEAATHFRRAVELHPTFADALSGLGAVLARQGRPTESLPLLDRALAANPYHLRARFNRALAWQNLDRSAEANPEFAALARANLKVTDSLLGLGNGFLSRGQFTEAVRCFEQVVQLQPDSVPALGRLAWLLATHREDAVRNGPRAVQLAQRACDLTRGADALSLNTLAAAYAETGRFDLAVTTAQRALAVAQSAGQQQVAVIIEKLIAMYQARTPYRE